MSHHEIDRMIFASAREWRRVRARIAANVRHGNNEQARADREMLPHLRQFGVMRGIVRYGPGCFELGTEHADSFYEVADWWGAIKAPGAFRRAAP